MPKQSPSDPKFRCNICEEYYFAPEHIIHYQCPTHGYLCSKHVGGENTNVYIHGPDNPNDFPDIDLHPKDDPYFDQIFLPYPTRIEKCIVEMKSEFNYSESGDDIYAYDSMSDSGLALLTDQDACLKKLLKFVWSDKAERWIEQGREKEDDFIKVASRPIKTKENNSNIDLLIELFEKNIINKEQFLEQLKEKLN
jgi:hypothetical protein